MNAELWSCKGQERSKLISWLNIHNIDFDEEMETEELRQIYIKYECGG